MNEIAYSLTNYNEIAPTICNTLNGELFENHYVYNGALGKAIVEFYDYDSFSVMYSKSKVLEDVKISRTKSQLIDFLAFDIVIRGFSNDFSATANDNLNRFNAGCYISTPSTESYCVYEKDIEYELLSVIIKKNWLESFIGKPLPFILSKPNEPLYIFTPVSKNLASSLSLLHQTEIGSSLRKSYLYIKTLEAIIMTIESLQLGNKEYRQHGFSPDELEIMFRLINWLQEHITEDTSIQSLSVQFGLNRNKLQSMFKSIFGQTLGEYARSVKMQKAYELLHLEYSVAEVGYQLGYSNLSHFSKAFKQEFGFNPSQVRAKK